MPNISTKKFREGEIDLFGPTGEFLGSLVKLDTGRYAYKAITVFMNEDTLTDIVVELKNHNINVVNTTAALLKNR